MIKSKEFKEATGFPPANDDLERCNCEFAGEPSHMFCGWCPHCPGPVFLCTVSSHRYEVKSDD